MRKWFVVLLACIALAGCSKSVPTYELIIGQKSIHLPVHDDPRLIQDDLIAAVKPLWDNLKQGESASFQTKRVIILEPSVDAKAKAKEKFGSGATVHSTLMKIGDRLRFFKGRDGEAGIEEFDEEGTRPCCHGTIREWNTMAEILRSDVFSLEQIRSFIQDQRPSENDFLSPAKQSSL